MDLFNNIIRQTGALFGASAPKVYKYDPSNVWKETKDFELVMQRETAFELGGTGFSSANFSCVTDSSELVPGDEILVYGKDLSQLSSGSSFARIAFIRTDNLEAKADSEATFRAIQKIDFVKYHVFPKGYMIRTSVESNREQVRVSKEAVKNGISFEKIGNTFISHYKEAKHVSAVKLVFITADDASYDELGKTAKQVHEITMTLSKILEGMPTDCHSCKLKPVCDEVEGLRELHFKGNGTEKAEQ